MTTSPDQIIGAVLDGRYRLDSILAKGGMATVYLASDLRLHRQVAVKVMHAALAEDADFVRRFEQEARAAASLTHQHVVSVHDQGNDGTVNAIYLVMELVPGHTVRELLQERGPLTAIQALAVMDPVLQALSAAHEAGFVHRDVKPENIIIGDNGRIKVTDFGLARAITTSKSMATTRGMLIGTVAYLSPEQVEQGKADERSDIYSAGIVLFEMLTGKLPHGGDTPIAVAFQHVHADIAKPSTVNSNVPSEMDYLVLRSTARDPRKRFATAEDFLDAVRKTRNYIETGSAHQLPPIEASVEQETIIIESPDLQDYAESETHNTLIFQKPKKRRTLLRIIAGLLIAISVYVYWSGTQTKVPQLVGLTQAQAVEAITTAELNIEVVEVFSEVVAKGTVISANPTSGSSLGKDQTVTLTISKGPEFFSVPNLKDMSLEEVRSSLSNIGLQLGEVTYAYSSDIKKNHAISAKPGFGELAKPNSLVSVVLSKGPAPIAIPDVAGESSENAIALLGTSGFNSVTIVKEFSNTVATGVVITQSPGALTEHLPKTQITLTVSKGVRPVSVPNIIGLTQSAAIQILTDMQLGNELIGTKSCTYGFKKNTKKVSTQSIAAGTKVAPGTVIGFEITGKCKSN
ncbi:MAG: Stk1 family PASTA domain-containing Ser/Thr kinase [Actinobacteria bacterium]|nr:Stk1 family PASTA domain-containing Ser/Thr kinase [Actinomycetota bacterium]